MPDRIVLNAASIATAHDDIDIRVVLYAVVMDVTVVAPEKRDPIGPRVSRHGALFAAIVLLLFFRPPLVAAPKEALVAESEGAETPLP